MNPLRPGPKLTDFPALIRSAPAMFRDLLARRYRQMPVGTLVGGILGFFYLVNPLDLIPEALPGIGVIDDALMLGVFLAFLSRDVKKYLLWKNPPPREKTPSA
ncbi:MAG: DUF1232 domain-containing protein [Verrucomicrobia bacterium]|nr:DUF1232 domain-containing protein [Verrucomicrobiota bacterium]